MNEAFCHRIRRLMSLFPPRPISVPGLDTANNFWTNLLFSLFLKFPPLFVPSIPEHLAKKLSFRKFFYAKSQRSVKATFGCIEMPLTPLIFRVSLQ